MVGTIIAYDEFSNNFFYRYIISPTIYTRRIALIYILLNSQNEN